MLSKKKLSRLCLNQTMLLLFLTPALCDLAFMGVQSGPQAYWVPIFTFNATLYTNFYECLVTRYNNCLIKYELSVKNVTEIVESGSSNISALPVYTCKNNESTTSILCSREDQYNCAIVSFVFAFVWNKATEYFYHPYLNNRTVTCVDRNYTLYFNKSDVLTTTEWTNVQSTPLILPSTLTTILKSTFSTTNNYSSTLESKDSKLPIILGTIGGVACLAFIIVVAVFLVRRVQQNRILLNSDNSLLKKCNPQNDTVPTNTISVNKDRTTPNDTVTVTSNIFTQTSNDTLGRELKYFNTIVEDDYTCIDDNERNSRVISARTHPETSKAIDSLKTDYTDIKITKENTGLISPNNTEIRKTNYDDSYNFISDTKDDYSRLGQDIRNVNNPYDGLLELKEEQSNVPQHELSPYTLAKPIPGSATLQVIDVGVCNDNLQPLTAASKHSVNTEHDYDTPSNTDIKRNVFGYTEVKKRTF
ncbi:uncharacterized protein LOC131947345 [Physella acuta]|uniref:uncharacterized protein LOC131947345 n=1 Tax=Physella acuta TaxID=109671 RepID=UPI0027DAE4BA|nr:uncharacterized protein LOC131947345 [Physella acuta]